ncbi:MAG: nitrous oxide reductase family maturation protein NosD [Planctomycetota bacterium]
MFRRVVHPASLVQVLLLVACGEPVVPGTVPPPCPAGGTLVAPGTALQAALAAADDGDVLVLAPGRHQGPLAVQRRVTVWGPRDAVVASRGEGSTIEVRADGARLSGFTVDGSGARFDLLDAGVRVRAEDVVLDGLALRRTLFGILIERSQRVTVRGCDIVGVGGEAMGLRGDGIRLWETTDSRVEGNLVRDCRDCVVWYSSRNEVVDNRVYGCRYGTHFMYSHHNSAHGNRYVDDVVGVFVMYSHDLVVRGNLMARAGGAAGVGLGFKESGNIEVIDNDFVANSTGIYVDTSPMDVTHWNRFVGNRVRLSDVGIAFHSSPKRNEFIDNDLRDNVHQVRVGGDGDATRIEWRGNHYDDYMGYDLDGDGRGDVPYVLASLSGQLTSRHPELAFFRGSPVLALTDLAGHVMPLFAPRTLLQDLAPRMDPPAGGARAR